MRVRRAVLVASLGLMAVTGTGCNCGVATNTGSDAGPDAGSTVDAGCTGVELTVKNMGSQCEVTIAGGAATTAAQQTVCVPQGAVALTATPTSGFELASKPWHRTDGDPDSGELGTVTGNTSNVTKTMASTPECVWVCCESTTAITCPNSDQCP